MVCIVKITIRKENGKSKFDLVHNLQTLFCWIRGFEKWDILFKICL